ncbi:hypothetical protein EVU96_24900 [Bacillus infantis]|uniref:baseplate J/gp47 family protein n=1 Tax=Bacillus infantis TaxID=324767 RepID=UPI00101DD32B|nr:baseplate J/gp47 family protein [Bacillus infantis]RYI25207.1 hypothetical protein EVU96_24900 [Bacillus infantis]
MLTSAGFKRKRYPDFLEEIEAQAKELFGEDENLTELSPLGKFIRLQAFLRAEDNELLEELWNSRFVDTSEGISLDHNVKRALMTRKEWRKASGTVKMTLEKGANIPAGTIFSTTYGVKFITLQDVKAMDNGEHTVKVEAQEFGNIGNVEAFDISIIVNPTVGLVSVANPEPFINGQDEETDEELRQRYYDSLGKNGNRRAETIRARVLDEVEGVRSCLVIENENSVPDEEGRPPHSFETIVLGGERQAVAQKIFEAKPGGIRAYGQEENPITDSQGFIHPIGFTYAATVSIYIDAKIKKGSSYPVNGDELVKEQIVKFIGGTNGDVQYNGLGMSEDVIQARLEARLFNVTGVEDAKVLLSKDNATFAEENIPIGFAEVAETDYSKIGVSDIV